VLRETVVRKWWVVPSSAEQQIEPEQIRSAQEAVMRGKTAPHDIVSAGILILAVLGIVYTLYFGKEILLPIALALVLKLLLQPKALTVNSPSADASLKRPAKRPDRVYPLAKHQEYDRVFDWEDRAN
jgi:hypothetical protein